MKKLKKRFKKRIIFFSSIFILIVFSVFTYQRYWKNCKCQRMNVLLIVLDTVRKDHLSCYGYDKNITPYIDKLAKNSTLFTKAYSTSSWTLPSHASMFTGLYTYSHGASQEHLFLEERFTTLAEILRKNGYQTAAFSANPFVGSGTNMFQGFNHKTEIITKVRKKNFIQKTRESFFHIIHQHPINFSIKRWWTLQYKQKKPFFVFINYIDAHAPYIPPKRYIKQNGKKEYMSRIKSLPQNWPLYYKGDIKYSEEEFELLRGLYDAEIKYLDDSLKDLLEFLSKRKGLKNTLLIVISDHGENIGDHGLIDHVFCLYNTTISIPLIINHPYLFPKGEECNSPVQINDIFPTITSVCNIKNQYNYDYVYSLLPKYWKEIPNNRIIFSEYFFPKQALNCFPGGILNNKIPDKYKRALKSVIIEKNKIIQSSDGSNELYNLEKDSKELNNLYQIKKEEYKILQEKMDYLKKILPKAKYFKSEPSFNKKDIERLKSLGYIK